jgi:hypothetical protein
MAGSAKTVAIIVGPGQCLINLSHLAAVPGGDTIKETDSSLIGAVIQPLGVILDLMSLTRKMSQSFFDFHAPVSQPGCVRWLNIVLHRSSLLPLVENLVKRIFEIISIVGIIDGPRRSVLDVRKWRTTTTVKVVGAKKMPGMAVILLRAARDWSQARRPCPSPEIFILMKLQL